MIIYGWRRNVLDLTTATYLCGRCGNPTAHALRRAVTKFTLFFIPLFPISSKYFTVCTFCGATNKLTKQEAQQVIAMNQTPQPASQPMPHQQIQPQIQAPPQQQPMPQLPPMSQPPFPQGGYPQQQQPGPYRPQ
jgi:zinc-ribbon family